VPPSCQAIERSKQTKCLIVAEHLEVSTDDTVHHFVDANGLNVTRLDLDFDTPMEAFAEPAER
jgi:hypothetical protein